MTHAVDNPTDAFGLTQAQLDIVSAAIPLTPNPVPEVVADRPWIEAGPDNEAGAVRIQSFSGPKLERLATYRFHRHGMLNANLFHAWTGEDYDFPILTTVMFENRGHIVLGSDLIPAADLAYSNEYYAQYGLAEHEELVAAYWPRLVEHRLQDSPPPNAFYTRQLGSPLMLIEFLHEDAKETAREFILDLTRLWTRLHAAAEPVPETDRVRSNDRRERLRMKAYKALDYHSPAPASFAAVMGWEGANAMFDTVFGPDDPPMSPTERRRYLTTDRTPGTAQRASS